MKKIGMFYGSDGGYTEDVCKRLSSYFENDKIDLFNIYETDIDILASYKYLILASSTWHDGHLQDDWNDFVDNLDKIDFKDKTIALLSLGDQDGYGYTFCDSLGILYDKVKEGKVIGKTSTQGYDYEESIGVVDDEFLGLCIDEDIQDDLTDERLKNWYEDIKGEFQD